MQQPILSLQVLSKFYTGSQSVVMGLNRISLDFHVGEFVAVTGESGSGKSTLAHVLSGILPYEGGEMLFQGKPTSHYDGADWERYRRDCVSFVSQSYGILPGCTVMRNVLTALRLSGMTAAGAAREAEKILRQVELWELRGRRAAKLSSGQKQRLSIARALAKPSPILLADEPTGNLDPENSEKVIRLLAQAAEERLVILITHEFSEAEEYVTRRINLRDGVVTADQHFGRERAAAPKEQPPRKKQRLGLNIAGVQLSGRPVWASLMLGFFALTAFAVFALLGTFIVNIDDTFTRIYDDSAFRNGAMERIVIGRSDGGQLTDEDIASFLAVEHAQSVQPYGYASDINYFYREGVDYKYHYSVDASDEDDRSASQSVELFDTGLYVQTVPMLADGGTFVTAGREPEGYYEAVAVGDESLIGTTVTVYIRDIKNWNVITMMAFEAEIVGVTDYGTGLYFHRDLVSTLSWQLRAGYVIFAPARDGGLAYGEFRMSKDMYSYYKPSGEGSFPMELYSYAALGDDITISATCVGAHDVPHNRYFEVSPELFEELKPVSYGTQATLLIDDYAYTEPVLEALHAMGYTAVSPFRECSTEQDATLAKQRMDTLTLCASALAVVLALQVIVLWVMFSMENESYRLLSNIGLDYRTARRSLLWQLLAFAAGGQLLAFGAVVLAAALKSQRILAIFRYMSPACWLILSGVHLAACAAAALWVMYSLRRQVYPFAAEQADLVMDEEAAL